MAKGGSPNEAGDQLGEAIADAILTGKTPETPKRTRGMEIAEATTTPSDLHEDIIVFHPPGRIVGIGLDCHEALNRSAAMRIIRQYIADAIDAAEPQCKLPVIEYTSPLSSLSRFWVGREEITYAVAVNFVCSSGFHLLADYPNLKERK